MLSFKPIKAIVITACIIAGIFSVQAHSSESCHYYKQETSKSSDDSKIQSYFHFSVGHTLEIQGKYQEAIREYLKALELDPQQLDIHIAIATAYYYDGDNEKAIEYCQYAIALDENNPTAHRLLGNVYYNLFISNNFEAQYAELSIEELEKVVALEEDDESSLLTLGRLYHFKKEYQKSLDYLFRHLQYNPNSPAGLQFIARNYMNLGKLSEALEYLKKIIENNPSDRSALSLMGSIYSYLKSYDKLIDIYKEYIKLHPSDAELITQLGLAYFDNSQFSEAEAEFAKALQIQPEHTTALNYLALTYHKLKKYTEAEQIYLDILEKNPTDIVVRYNLAKIYGENRDYEKAINTYNVLMEEINKEENDMSDEDKAIILSNKAWVHYQLGEYEKAAKDLLDTEILSPKLTPNFVGLLIMSLHESGLSDEAMNRCDKAIAQFPENHTYHIIKSDILADLGQREKGIKLLRKFIEEDKTTPQIYLGIANIYMDAKQYSKAEESLAEGLNVFSKNEDLSFTLGAAYERMGRYDLAEKAFKEVIASNPKHDEALNYLGYMLAERGIRLEEALEYIKRALEVDSTNGSYLDSLGWAYYRLNNLVEAKKYLELAATREPKSAEIRHHLGDLYHRLGQLERAVEYWQKALTLKPDNEQEIQQKIKEALRNHQQYR